MDIAIDNQNINNQNEEVFSNTDSEQACLDIEYADEQPCPESKNDLEPDIENCEDLLEEVVLGESKDEDVQNEDFEILKNKAVIIVSHNLEEAKKYSDKIINITST